MYEHEQQIHETRSAMIARAENLEPIYFRCYKCQRDLPASKTGYIVGVSTFGGGRVGMCRDCIKAVTEWKDE